MSEELKDPRPTRWECDACAESEGGSGLPCTLTSALVPENSDLLCPVSGEECEFTVAEDPKSALFDEMAGALEAAIAHVPVMAIAIGSCKPDPDCLRFKLDAILDKAKEI